ncbi:virion protein [Colwellia sp. E2M01]|uniref:virion protein n=1 Tax=Colwellia sp. E2M01 TaxID=2841561 RepID=UPI002091CE96|nr:virion protein [Colwellia sp. E2M01]
MKNNSTPRGIRNNNPLNIRTSNDDWFGSVGNDGSFVQFETAEHGIRAASRILKSYRDKYGLTTITEIITRWAPPTENDTDSYINSVAQKVGVSAEESLSEIDYIKLIEAMIYHENGQQPYTISTIQDGFKMGFYS